MNMKWSKLMKNTNTKVLSVICVIFLLLPVISLVINPLLMIVQYNMRISEGSILWNLMQDEVKSVFVYCYVFNITNAEAFLAGEDDKLRVEDVGPFTYQEYRRMEEQELDEAEGVMRFTLRTRSKFVPEKSIGDPRDINVTSANMISLAVASKISFYPYFTKSGFNLLMNIIKSKSIITKPAYDLLWGYDDPLLSMGKSLLPMVDFESLGMLKRLFDTNLKTRIEMAISTEDKFRIKTVNNLTGIVVREYDDPSKRTKCNTYENTYEGIGLPPDLKPEKPLRIFRELLCRLLDLQYVGTETLDYGPVALKYKLDDNTYSKTTSTECLCQGKCIDGVTDMSPCFYGLSIGMSNAHFLYANPSMYDRIVGIHPDENKHGSEFLIDTMTGMMLKTVFSLQINVVVEDVSYNEHFKPFSNMVVPIAHFKVEQPEIPEEVKELYSLMYNIAPYAIHSIEGILIIIGAGILVFIFYIKFSDTFMPDRNITYHIPETIITKTDSIIETNSSQTDYKKLRVLY